MVLVVCVVVTSHVTCFKYVAHVNVALFSRVIGLPKSFFATHAQWNLGLMEGRPRTGEIGSLYQGFVISRFFFIHYNITGLAGKYRSFCRDFVV